MKRLLIIYIFLTSIIAGYALQPERGYRGFVDVNSMMDLNFGFLVGDPGDSNILLGLNTSHGYQLKPWLYVGGGTGFVYNLNWKKYDGENAERFIIPVFAEARLDAKWRRFTPYFSMQLGANVANHGGVYAAPTVGYRFNWGRNTAINFGLGATIYGRQFSYYDYVTGPNGWMVEGQRHTYQGHIVHFTARLGVEF